MTSHHEDSFESNARKRVGKACDRCRLKKSKCDGQNPCNRCKLDNALCVFGERKKSQDRVYPKGYVEMIEEQQISITNGLRQTYQILLRHGLWEGPALQEHGGHPLTHDILVGLGVLQSKNGSPPERFEDDLEEVQVKLMKKNGAVAQSKVAPPSPSIESSCSSPASRSFSISSHGSRKRFPDTPPSESASPLFQPKKLRTSLHHANPFPQQVQQQQQQQSSSPAEMLSPESVDFGFYSPQSPVDNNFSYSQQSTVDSTFSYLTTMPMLTTSTMNYNTYSFPLSPMTMDTNFGSISNPSLTVDPQIVDQEFGTFAQTGSVDKTFNYALNFSQS